MKLLLAAAVFSTTLFAADPVLEDTNWVAVELMGVPVMASEGHPAPNIALHSVDKKMSGFSGCNSIFGGYEAAHEGLKFDPVGATRIACLGPNAEAEFLQALTSTVTYRIPANSLELLDKDGKVLGKFRASGPAEPVAPKR